MLISPADLRRLFNAHAIWLATPADAGALTRLGAHPPTSSRLLVGEIDGHVAAAVSRFPRGSGSDTTGQAKSAAGGSLRDSLAIETEQQLHVFRSEDFEEGSQAFLEKRSPRFKGR